MVWANPPGARGCTLLSFHQYPEEEMGTLVGKEQDAITSIRLLL